MPQEKKLFPAQGTSEKILNVIRKHWFTYFVFWIIALIMTVPLIFIIIYWLINPDGVSSLAGNIIILFASAYSLFICGLLIYGFTDYYLDVYIITDHRIVDIKQDGFFKRKISELNLRQIQDINAEVDGFAATLLHFGNVHIQTAAEHPNFVFGAISHPYETSKKILDLHEAYIQKYEKKETAESKNDPIVTVPESLTKTRFEEESEACYSEDTCRQKLLEGINKYLKEPGMTEKTQPSDQGKELKDGEEAKL